MDAVEPKRSILLPSRAEQAGGDNVRIVESELPDRRERGRSREKLGTPRSGVSRSRSRTGSRLRVDSDTHLRWTVLRHDPSERLHESGVSHTSGRSADRADDQLEDGELEDLSDEEQVSDVDDDVDIDAAMDYDQGSRVLPNFTTSIWKVLEAEKAWVASFEHERPGHGERSDTLHCGPVRVDDLPGGYARAAQVVSSGSHTQGPAPGTDPDTDPVPAPRANAADADSAAAASPTGARYVLYLDLTSESFYAFVYTVGSVLCAGDTLYVVHSAPSAAHDQLRANLARLRSSAAYLLDCAGAVLERVHIVLLSVSHPYQKHLLNELVVALQPTALCVPLSLVLSSLQNYVCPVPTIVIRRKLKRSKKKGIYD